MTPPIRKSINLSRVVSHPYFKRNIIICAKIAAAKGVESTFAAYHVHDRGVLFTKVTEGGPYSVLSSFNIEKRGLKILGTKEDKRALKEVMHNLRTPNQDEDEYNRLNIKGDGLIFDFHMHPDNKLSTTFSMMDIESDRISAEEWRTNNLSPVFSVGTLYRDQKSGHKEMKIWFNQISPNEDDAYFESLSKKNHMYEGLFKTDPIDDGIKNWDWGSVTSQLFNKDLMTYDFALKNWKMKNTPKYIQKQSSKYIIFKK
jgi:hypothetical protein